MRFKKVRPFAVVLTGLFIFSACTLEVSIHDELSERTLSERVLEFDEEVGDNIRLASAFLVDVIDKQEDGVYDYIIDYEDFYFNKVFLQTRWNDLVEDISRSFLWGGEAYEYIRDNYDELWEWLKEQLRSELAVTLLAYQLGFEADQIALNEILADMEAFIYQARDEGVDIEGWFVDMFGTTQYTWEIQLERQLASIAMLDAMWDMNPFSEFMMVQFSEDVPFEDLPYRANIYHILVDTEEEAHRIYEMVKAGMHPRDLHEEFSQDPGGPHYIFPRGTMVEPFEEWAFSAEAGDIGIVPTQFGFHVTLSYGKEVDAEELEHLARLHYLDIHIIGLIRDMDIRWASQPETAWFPQR